MSFLLSYRPLTTHAYNIVVMAHTHGNSLRSRYHGVGRAAVCYPTESLLRHHTAQARTTDTAGLGLDASRQHTAPEVQSWTKLLQSSTLLDKIPSGFLWGKHLDQQCMSGEMLLTRAQQAPATCSHTNPFSFTSVSAPRPKIPSWWVISIRVLALTQTRRKLGISKGLAVDEIHQPYFV
jgi:hypothetical protein